jgi:hypothetical protein
MSDTELLIKEIEALPTGYAAGGLDFIVLEATFLTHDAGDLFSLVRPGYNARDIS